MSSKQPPSKRKRKASKSLLMRLSESCNSHRNNCHSNQDELTEHHEELGDPSDLCSSDMKALKQIIPKIESACQCQHSALSITGTCVSNAAGSKKKEKVDPKEIMHLCFFYISVVECTYCPHAMNLLFDNGRNGVEIFPRVHQLLRHLASESMVQDTIKSLRRRKNTRSKHQLTGVSRDPSISASVSDQISRTCAVLLNSIPEQTLQVDVVHDLIQFLQDLATIQSIGVLSDPIVNGQDIKVFLFTGVQGGVEVEASSDSANITEERGGDIDMHINESYGVELGTQNRLFLLQSGVIQLLIQLFALHYCQQLEGDDNSTYGSQWKFVHGEQQSMLIKCIRQVLETSSSAEAKSTSMLSMRSKVMACGLLFLLMPPSLVHTEFGEAGRLHWMDLTTMAVRVHFQYIGNYVEKDSSTSGDLGLERLVNLVSVQYLTMLQNICLYHRMWGTGTNKCIQRLCDCIPDIIKATRKSFETKSLARMVLRVIQSAICPRVEIQSTDLKEESGVSINGIERTIVSVFNHCKVNSLCQPMVELLSIPSYTSVVVSIITQLCCNFSDGFSDQVCEFVLREDVKCAGNKRQRLGEDSSYTDVKSKSYSVLENESDLNFFVPVLVTYFLCVMDAAGEVMSFGIERNGSFMGEDFSTFLKTEGVRSILDTIFILESFLFMEQKHFMSPGRPIFYTLERLYEASSIISKALLVYSECGSDDMDIGDTQYQIAAVLTAMSRIFYNHLPVSFLPDNLFKVREELLISFKDALTRYWLCDGSSTRDNYIKDFDDGNDCVALASTMEEFLVNTPTDQKEQVSQYLSTRVLLCPVHCLGLKDILVLNPTGLDACQPDCHCWERFRRFASSIGRNMDSFMLVYLEASLSLQQWTIMTLNIFACTLENTNDILKALLQSNVTEYRKILFLATLPSTLVPLAPPSFTSDLHLGDPGRMMSREGDECLRLLKEMCVSLSFPKECDDSHRTGHTTMIVLRCLPRVILNCASTKHLGNEKSQIATDSDLTFHLSRPSISQTLIRFLDGPMLQCELAWSKSIPLQMESNASLQIIDIFKDITLNRRMLNNTKMRKALWEFALILFACSPIECFKNLLTIRLHDDDESFGVNVGANSGHQYDEDEISSVNIQAHSGHQYNHTKNKTNQPATVQEWLFNIPFADEDNDLRTCCAQQLGKHLFRSNCKLAKLLLQNETNGGFGNLGSTLHDTITALFDEIDNKLHNYCGVTQSELSLSLRTTQSIDTYTSHNSADVEALSVTCSRQISAIKFISELCQHVEGIGVECSSLVLEKGIMRLVRLWITASSYPHDDIHSGSTKSYSNVALAASHELLVLRDTGAFSPKCILSYDETLIPGLVSEILSRCFYAQKLSLNMQNHNSSEFNILVQFMTSFLMPPRVERSLNITSDGQDEIYGVLTSFDKLLPTTIAGLVLEQDYDSICSCTKFRMYLLSELKRLERKAKVGHGFDEKLVGKTYKKRQSSSSKKSSGDDLKRQTAKLCIMNESNLDILGPILKSLLLESDKAPLLFFLKTVVRSEVSFGQLLKNSEFSILDDLVWELGASEDDLSGNNYTEGSWKILYKDHGAYHALKRAALWLQRSNDQREKDEHSSSPPFSLDSHDHDDSSSKKIEVLVEQWMHKYFMRLLVNVTTKWKRGRIEAKISSMKSLRVLLRFLRPEDAEQYITAIFGIIDGCMNLESPGQDSSFSRLCVLAVRNLSHFTQILLSHDLKVVGDNLCNIIVSLFPLFDRPRVDDLEHDDDPIFNGALGDGVYIFELLTGGKTGKSLAPYFGNIPFLPKHEKLEHVRNTLKKYGVNFDNLLLLSTQLSSDQRGRDGISSTSSVLTEEEEIYAAQRNKLQMAMRKRLQSMGKFLNHENDNVRKVCLMHVVDLIRSHRDLFYALLQVEDASHRFLTVKSEQEQNADVSCSMNSFIQGLLKRCVLETNADLRLLLSVSLGEIGAISPTYMDQDSKNDGGHLSDEKRWIIEKGVPWKSSSVKIHYKLQLVTNYFVTALKAAPTPTDQHKIAFAIQEVLKQLDMDASDSNQDDDNIFDASGKKRMNPWLKGQLEQANVYSIIEPYWTSLYKQNEASKTKSPPFFEISSSYYLWLAEWGRFMVERSNESKRSCFSELFFACRSAIRSEAGLGVLEFILPLLVLDSLCFGDTVDRRSTVHELKSVVVALKESKMEKLELQKSVDIVFMVLETLQCWAENEMEERYKTPRSGGKGGNQTSTRRSRKNTSAAWPPDESLSVIEELLNMIPFDLCAEAAAHVGMHAQSLRFLEMHSRKIQTGLISDSAGDDVEVREENTEAPGHSKGLLRPSNIVSFDIGLAHRLFGLLDDRDSMTAIVRCRKNLNVFDQLYEKESCNDWDGVLRACELAYQIKPSAQISDVNLDLEKFQTKALLELGHFDNVLNQVAGITNSGKFEGEESKNLNIENDLIAHAINASWRLGRWESLGRLVQELDMRCTEVPNTALEADRQYDFKLGKALLGLHKKDSATVLSSLREARESIIPSLSVVAGEDYPRAYPYLIKLQSLREVEDIIIKERGSLSSCSSDPESQDVSIPKDIIAVRLALSRVLGDLELEASLWLSAGRKARKEGFFHLAENYLSHADALYHRLQLPKDSDQPTEMSLSIESNANEVRLQIAKMKHSLGQSTEALRMIEVGDFEAILSSHNPKHDLANLLDHLQNKDQTSPFTRNALQSTEWMIQSGLQSGSEAIERYKLLSAISPNWERAHFKYAKYLDSVVESRISLVAARANNGGSADDESGRAKIIMKEISCHKYILETIKEYGKASQLGQKHVFQALPRLLTLWFDFTAIEGDDELGMVQEEVNKYMVSCIKTIPPVAYYSVLPQLISRIGHVDEDTATIVCAILKRQLMKFPTQAMWHLSWLRQSVHKDRRDKGEEIFKSAQKGLRKNDDLKHHDLLESSKGLVAYLINLAKYIPKRNDQKSINIKQSMMMGKAELQDFLPPVQAALTVTRSATNSSNNRDIFPRQVPRMRAFSGNVQVMASKAKPKKLTAFAIPEGLQSSEISRFTSNKSQPCDIGEMHFLVKREAKGDLRKDARVQDLNTVINRLFSSSVSNHAAGIKQHRRLKLRTFSVVCLSEDCGILEWVPNTDSLRNVVSSSYNPHASPHSARRRGKHMTNFADMNLRNKFATCQDQYFKHGNLTKAAEMFQDLLLKEYPALFYWWFVRRFEDPHKWFEARTRFALSAAAWAAVGHVIGLGDRHSENILIDTTCGECVHVDFDCIFDKGLCLPKPEVIPFRLTPNMVDAFGPTGADGAFSGGLMSAMTTLRENRDILLSVLEPFLRDPVIEWKRTGTAENNKNIKPVPMEAKKSMRVIDERLTGIYNLKNPNHKKVRRIDREVQGDDDEMASLMPLSVEGQVHKMIAEATSHENLVQVYIGWMPWL